MLRINLRLLCSIAFFLILALLASSSPPPAQAQSPCGVWQLVLNPQDSRVAEALIDPGSGANCRGAVRLSNGTELPLFGGGYSMELDAYSIWNSGIQWMPALVAHGNQSSKADLMPSLDIELHAIPNVGSPTARVYMCGEMTSRSLAEDTSLFLLKTALELVPGISCVIPKQQLV